MAAVDTHIAVDCDSPGGNMVVDSIDGDTIAVHQDLRDTEGDWFYWCFRVRGAAGRTLTVRFADPKLIGVRGPAASLDGGWTWRWLGADTVDGQSFRYPVPADAAEVRFSFGMPYLGANLSRFLARHRGNPHLEAGVLCTTEKGRQAELLRLGRLDGGCDHRVLLTCRHHCCEMMASYSLEGIGEPTDRRSLRLGPGADAAPLSEPAERVERLKREMTSRQRLWAALSRQQPDRVPIWMPYPRERLGCYVDVHTLPSYAPVMPSLT